MEPHRHHHSQDRRHRRTTLNAPATTPPPLASRGSRALLPTSCGCPRTQEVGNGNERPSGGIEDDEDPLTTVERELAEEIGRSDPLALDPGCATWCDHDVSGSGRKADPHSDEVERRPCPRCDAPAGSRAGAVAGSYHTGRFNKIPRLAKRLRVTTPPTGGLGQPWRPGTPLPAPVAPEASTADICIGSRPLLLPHPGTAVPTRRAGLPRYRPRQDLRREDLHPRLGPPRVREGPGHRPADQGARPHSRVILTVYEMKRLGRDAAELTAPADHLTAHGLVLEMPGTARRNPS
ncbi:NUDIX domain-containing protein [Spirillospora sp. CA-255316]